jgi:hypothetical protein
VLVTHHVLLKVEENVFNLLFQERNGALGTPSRIRLTATAILSGSKIA